MHNLKTIGIAALAAAVTLTGCSQGDGGSDGTGGTGGGGDTDYPEDDITYVIPYPAGSAPDAQGRIIAQQLEDDLGVSVVVQNVEGGAGTIGLYDLARADADGYTIGIGTASAAIQSRAIDTPFEGLESLTPIAQTTETVNVLYATPDKGWDTFEDFVAEAKERPGELQVGLPPAGSGQHIGWLAFEEAAGIDVREVHFDAGQMVLPAVNGTVDASVSQPGPVVQYVEKGDLGFLGAWGEQLPEGLDAPLFVESGLEVNRFVGWEGVFGPAEMPDDARDVLAEAIQRAVESDAFQQHVAKTYGVAEFIGGDDFTAVVEETDAVGAEIVEELEMGN
ncbi:MAG: tripartite tricarboxylate transporter substrate binding protein [Euzebyales bacterium]|nr:tripartite tricarboxylate transporter substrate binding protein [Euzebyales bacterium]